MYAEEGKLRVGDGVDEMPHQVLAVWPDLVVLAAEGENSHVARLGGELGDAVGV